jgi:DNA recombination protein RmuC
MPVLATLTGLVATAGVFFVLGRLVGTATASASARQEILTIRTALAEATTALSKETEKHAEKLAAYGHAEKLLKDAFGALAGSALESNSRQFLDLAETRFKSLEGETKAELDARKSAIDTLIAPLGKSLKDLDGKVADLEAKRIQAYTEVATQISELAHVNKELRTQTGNLVKALRSPNVRGNWGQMQLRRTVEIAGMLDHCDFLEQVSAAVEGGRLRPDMIVRLPSDRRVVVDAKVPLMGYLESVEATTEEERLQHLKTHAAQVREHMSQLSNKKYWEQFTPTPEFVVMFLPVEALFATALQQDASLLEFGAEKRVIPASPLTLIALLRAVNYGWKEASLARDAAKVQELGKSLYDSVGVLARHLGKMRDHLEGTVQAFNASVGSVERSFLSRARKLKDLNAGGEESVQRVDAIDERLRIFDAPELRDELVQASLIEGIVLTSADRES